MKFKNFHALKITDPKKFNRSENPTSSHELNFNLATTVEGQIKSLIFNHGGWLNFTIPTTLLTQLIHRTIPSLPKLHLFLS